MSVSDQVKVCGNVSHPPPLSVVCDSTMAENDLMDSLDQQLQAPPVVLEGVEIMDPNHPIGSGSYAKVFRGKWNGIPVAVKKLHEVFFDRSVTSKEQDGLLETFRKELYMNMRIRHPNIIQFLGISYNRGDPNAPMMVMELFGSSLAKRLTELREKGVRMSLHEVINVAADVAAGLVYLHELQPKSIVHRDLAPKNILLSADGHAKLCDLGVAKATDVSRGHTMGPGTLAFMPPEVMISKNYSPTPVDVYSFGVTLLEMCSGVDTNPGELMRVTDPIEGNVRLVPEKERREDSFAALGRDHLLEELVNLCLQTAAEVRPKAKAILECLLGLKESEEYMISKQNAATGVRCLQCAKKDKFLEQLQRQLEENNLELQESREEIKKYRGFHEQQLVSLQEQLETVVKDAQKHQEQMKLLNDSLKREVEANKALQSSNQRTMHWNELLRQKVEMDSNPDRFSNPPQKPPERKVQSTSVRCGEKPRPKPRKRKLVSQDTLPLESNHCDGSDPQPTPAESSPLTRTNSVPPSLNQAATYLKLDANAMMKHALCYVKTPKMQTELTGSAGSVRSDARGNDECVSTTENGEDHIYTEISLPPEPPTPPPRLHALPHRPSTWHVSNRQNAFHAMPKIIETSNEYAATSPILPGIRIEYTAEEQSSQPQRKVQSMRARLNSPISPSGGSKRPQFMRQGSRGDVLISRVTSSYKSKSLQELSVTKGELVKVTNAAMDKKWCIVVNTEGRSGSVKKKYLERVEPVDVLYDESNPMKSRQNGIIGRIAICNKQNMWMSPIESHQITITSSSLHLGEVNMLVKMTDYLLCCTDGEPQSSFEIDLHMQRLVKLTGYILQCHNEGNNGYPKYWKLEGSHNGNTWAILSEESGDFFREGCYAQYFEVTNPTPCRYFRLTQLEKNSAGNHRFCLSGLELFGHLYSSSAEEMHTHRIH